MTSCINISLIRDRLKSGSHGILSAGLTSIRIKYLKAANVTMIQLTGLTLTLPMSINKPAMRPCIRLLVPHTLVSIKCITPELVGTRIMKLAKGKANGPDDLSAEDIIYALLSLCIAKCKLFRMIVAMYQMVLV